MDKEAITQEELYPVQDLINNCEALTGYKKEIAVGALFDCKKKQLTKEEFKDKIKVFLERKVK